MILKRRNVEVEAFDEKEIRELKREGFEPIFIEPEEEKALEEPKKLEELTVKELRELAKDKGLELSKTLKKQDLIEILEETNDGAEEAEATAEA